MPVVITSVVDLEQYTSRYYRSRPSNFAVRYSIFSSRKYRNVDYIDGISVSDMMQYDPYLYTKLKTSIQLIVMLVIPCAALFSVLFPIFYQSLCNSAYFMERILFLNTVPVLCDKSLTTLLRRVLFFEPDLAERLRKEPNYLQNLKMIPWALSNSCQYCLVYLCPFLQGVLPYPLLNKTLNMHGLNSKPWKHCSPICHIQSMYIHLTLIRHTVEIPYDPKNGLKS